MAGGKNVSVTEPHPSVPKAGNAYIYGGRGGSGNYKRYKVEEISAGPSATGPPSRINLSKTFKRQLVPSGRGGTGNMFKANSDPEERMFQFDEEMMRRNESQAPVYHIGRGGAANYFDERETSSAASRARQSSAASTGSNDSNESTHSNVRGALNKLTRRWS